jgi:MbtH protein
MDHDQPENATVYKVIVDHDEQYSIWPANRMTVPGWKEAGKSGTREECLAFIAKAEGYVRPLSQRKKT